MTRTYDLEERLITFSIRILNVAESLPQSRSGAHLASQLTRSGTSPALNCGEAQGAESKKDFVHKMRIILKELRETRVCLIIIIRKPICENSSDIEADFKECNELIAIFAKSIKTVQSNLNKK